MSKKTRNFALGTLIGASVGYLAGILTAKQSGKETRKDIAEMTIKAKNKAEKTIKQLHGTLVELLEEGEQLLKSTKSTAQKGFVEALEKAKRARNRAREVLSAIHEGDATDEDLQKAIQESTSAIEHLKSYLKKDKPESK